ncbi:MFS transporter [Rhodoflexus sp.]
MLNAQKRLTAPFYALLSLPATAMGFALSVQISALSWLLSTQYQLNIEEVGFVWAAGPLAGIFGQVIVGLISDNVWFWGGRRRPFILVGGLLAALMLLALPAIGTINDSLGIGNLLAVAIAVALLLDLSINISFNPTRSIIADVTPEGEARTKGYTWMQTVSGAFGVLAYLIGAVFGNLTLIYAGAVLVLLFSIVPMFFITEPRELKTIVAVAEENRLNSTQTTQNQSLLPLYLAHAFTWLGVQTMFVFMFAFLKERIGGLSDMVLGQVIAVAFAVLNTVGFLLPAPVLAPLSKKIGRVRTHTLSIAVMAAGYAGIFLFGHSAWAIYALMAVVGVGWAATVSLPFAIMTEKIDKSKTGLYMGIFNLSVVLPQLVVSSFFGKIIENSENKGVIFIICTAALTVSAVLWLLVKEDKKATTASSQSASGGGH